MLYKKDHFDDEITYRNISKRNNLDGSVELIFSDKSDDLACSLIKEYYGDFNKIEHRLPKVLEVGKKIVEVINPLDKNQMSPYTLSRYGFHSFIDDTEILDVFRHEIIGFKIEVETNLTDRNPNLILSCEYLFPITYKFVHLNSTAHRQYVFKHGGFKKNITLDDYYFNQLFERWITGDGKTASLRRADFYREVSPPDQLSSLTQGTPIGRADNPDGTTPHSALPNGDSSRNIGRPSPDSPNLKYRNLDRADAYGRKPAEGQDFGYVHDSGSGSARVIPYDSGFSNNSSALRKSAKNVPKDPKLWEEVQALAKGESDKPVVRGENSVNPVNDGKGFTTFPSAYANGWALAQYKRLGGGWKKESKQAGLIKPPKHLVDKVSEILTAAFASILVNMQKMNRASEQRSKSIPLSIEHIYRFDEQIDDLLNSYMSVKKGRSTFEDFKSISRDVIATTQDILDSGGKAPRLENLIEDLSELEDMTSIEEAHRIELFLFKLFNKERVINRLEKIIEKNNRTSPSIILESSWETYERLAKEIKKYKNIYDPIPFDSWVLQTEELGTLRLQVRPSNKGFGAYRYDENNKEHRIQILANSDYQPFSTDFLKHIKDFVQHELVHVIQKEMSLKYNVDQAGVPNKKYDKTYTQRDMGKKKEKELKDQYAREGLDPKMIQIHALDDIEFYSRLLDEVVWFQRENRNVRRSDLNEKVHAWISESEFFVSLKRFKRDNWSKAVGIFFKAIESNESVYRVACKWVRNAGLIRPPKHLVDKISEVLTAGFASYWVEKQKEVESKPYLSISLEQITNLENLIEDLDEAYMSVRLGEATFDDFNIALRGLRIATQELVGMFEGQIHPTLEKMVHILESMTPNSVFEEPKKYKNEFMFLGNRTFGLISDLKSMGQQRVSHISDTSRRLYEREASKVKRFDKFLARSSQSTWVFQTEELGTLRVQVRESKGAKGLAYYRYNETDGLHTITVRVFPNSTDLSEKELGKIKDYVRHELVHAMQKQMSLNFNVEQAGIPFQKRDMTYLQGHDYKEKELKDQYAMEGLDSDLVSIHALDDIEFYSRLLDEVVEFQKLNVSRSDLNQEVHEWIAKRRFFVSLKRFKRENWSKAVGIFFDAVNSKSSAVRVARKWSEEYCKKKDCEDMGFSEKASCRPYKNCYKKEAVQRDNPKLKNTGKGGLGTWFAGHGGGNPDDRATWGDWIAITPIKHTVEKEDGSKKEYEAGDIVGPCAISSSKEWAEVTSKGKKPMKCMPREKAYQMSKEDRATLAKKKRREEAKHRGQKPVNTPTFSEEAKDMIKNK